jgi:hypothetical protein
MFKFPHDAHDDFVDALAYIGLGLQQQTSFSPIKRKTEHAPHTFGALIAARKRFERSARERSAGGW